jgi:hypothetical protein
MHNTVVLDGRTFAAPQGPFHWRTRTDARLLTACISPEWDFAVGSHDGYVPHRHTRAVLALHGIGWLIADRITGRGRINAEAWWHLHPDWQPTVCDGIVHLQSSDRCLALATTAPDVTIVNDAETAAYAPEYGRLEPASVIRAARTGCDTLTIGTFVPHPDAARDSLAMVELASEEQGRWVICPFGVWTGGREYRIDIAFPAGDALPSDWPQPCIAELKQSCVE